MDAMQPVDNVQTFLVGFQRADGFRKFGFRQRAATPHPFWNAGRRIKALVLHKEDNSLGRARCRRCVCHRGSLQVARDKTGAKRSTRTGGNCLQHVSTIDHCLSLRENTGSWQRLRGWGAELCKSNCGKGGANAALQLRIRVYKGRKAPGCALHSSFLAARLTKRANPEIKV